MSVERDESAFLRLVGQPAPRWGCDAPEWQAMRQAQLERWPESAKAGVERVRRVRPDVADGLLSALYLEGQGPRWIQAYFETVTWLVEQEGAGVAVDRLLASTSAEGLAEVVERLKRSRMLARLQVQKQLERHAEIWRRYGMALLALGALLGRLRASGIDEEDLAMQREAWCAWIVQRPGEASVKGMQWAMARSVEAAEVLAGLPADVRRWLVLRWNETNALRVVRPAASSEARPVGV